MKVVTCTKFGPPEVLQLQDFEKPTPGDHEILVKIQATTVTIGDVIIRRGRHPDSRFYTLMLHVAFGIRRPRVSILGMEIAGDVEAVGEQVTRFRQGDQVFGSTFSRKFGGYAEYKCLPEDGVIVIKPPGISYEEAATIPGGGMTALRCLRKAKVGNEQSVLIIGASGAVGTNAVQLAKYFGAHVTGVCSTANVDLVNSLGADAVIDYSREDFTEKTAAYDVIFDAVAKVPASRARRALKKGGVYLNVLRHSGSGEDRTDLVFLKDRIEEGKLKQVIDRRYTLEQIVEAHRYVEEGHKRGHVVIKIPPTG
jgi:NADPH:quinone reductase-like Zn-dependent oxidoreductase